MFLPLEFEQAGDYRSDATRLLRISHKRLHYFLLVLLKTLPCCEEDQATHVLRPHGEAHVGVVSGSPAKSQPTESKCQVRE